MDYEMNGRTSSESEWNNARYLLLLVGALLIAFSLTPFQFSFSFSELQSRFSQTLSVDFAEGWRRMVVHFAGFIILGALLVAAQERFVERLGFRGLMVVAVLFCLGLEFTQLGLPDRHARVTDLLANALGLWIGALASLRRANFSWWKRSRMPATCLFVLVAVLAATIWVGAGILPLRHLARMDWDRTFHLLVGAESDGAEGFWLGEIGLLRIHGRALSSREVSQSYENLGKRQAGESRAPLDALVAYDFTRAPTNVVRPTGTLASESLALEIPHSCQWSDREGGLLISEPARLVSQSPASELTEAMMAAREFSVEAWLRPATTSQGHDGPARIVSVSAGIWARNLMLGQDGADLVFRVRNGINGPNGLRHALRVPGAFRAGWQHLVATYDHGFSQVFSNGRLLETTLDLRDPTVYVRLGTGAIGHGVAGGLLALMVAVPIYVLSAGIRSRGARHVLAIAAAVGIGSLPYAICCAVLGGPWRLGLFVGQGMALAMVYPLALWYVRQPSVTRSVIC